MRSTAEIGPFVILSEGSVGAGARRIEAVTSGEAFALLAERSREPDELRGELESCAQSREEKRAGRRRRRPTSTNRPEAEKPTVLLRSDEGEAGELLDLPTGCEAGEGRRVVISASQNGRAHLVVNFDEAASDEGSTPLTRSATAAALVGGGGGGHPTLAGGRRPELRKATRGARRAVQAGAIAERP